MARAVIHLNIADFAVAVARRLDYRLKGRPVVVAPGNGMRAKVYDMSEEAYASGVRKGMLLGRVRRYCPEVQVVPPCYNHYRRAMHSVTQRVLPFSPRIEAGEGDGHLFVDVTGTSRLFGPPIDVARRLRRQIEADLGLSPIWSLAPNKLVAKIATRLVKPQGEYIVAAGEEEALLAPLPLFLLPGLEDSDLARLHELNLSHVHQAARLSAAQLKIPFGRRAHFIYESLRGIDASPVQSIDHRLMRIACHHEFEEDSNDPRRLEGALYHLVERAGQRLRKHRLFVQRIMVRIDYSDGMRRIRQLSAKPATANDFTLFELARAALYLGWKRRVRVRYLTLVCSRLVFPPTQQMLFPDRSHKKREQSDRLLQTLDRIRSRFGNEAVSMGRTLATRVN